MITPEEMALASIPDVEQGAFQDPREYRNECYWRKVARREFCKGYNQGKKESLEPILKTLPDGMTVEKAFKLLKDWIYAIPAGLSIEEAIDMMKNCI